MTEDLAPIKTSEILNRLWGMAAIAVSAMHFSPTVRFSCILPAVDISSVLRGFVIPRAYGHRLTGKFENTGFMVARVIRVSPLYLLGLVMRTVATGTYQWLPESYFHGQLAFALFMLPRPLAFDGTNHDLFPFNFTCWSLFFELIADLGYAVLAPRLSERLLGGTVLLGVLGLVASGLITGPLDNGVVRPTFLDGMARVTFGFSAGVALYRRWWMRPTTFALPPSFCSPCSCCPYRTSRIRRWVGSTN